METARETSNTSRTAMGRIAGMRPILERAVRTSALQPWFGSRYAIKFIPRGWAVAAGRTYAVRVTGVTPEIQYDVFVAACN